MSIYIFSRPIHSGKTTALLQWCDEHQNIAGVLMPDIGGSRKVLDLTSKDIFDIECTDPLHSNEALTPVGKFHFFTASFEKANTIIELAIGRNPRWLVIDEAGKLELEGKGFYASLIKAIDFYDRPNSSGNLMITVRDSLCEPVIHAFGIKNYTLIDDLAMIGA